MSNRIAGSMIAILLLCIGAMAYVELTVLNEYSRVASEYQIAAGVRTDTSATLPVHDESAAASAATVDDTLPASVEETQSTDEVACLQSGDGPPESVEIDS